MGPRSPRQRYGRIWPRCSGAVVSMVECSGAGEGLGQDEILAGS